MRILLLTAATLAAILLAGAGPADARERPNVLVIMTDDQTVADMRVMPRTRAHLAAEGTTFVNSFVDFALCCPSRATFFTGQYTHNHGVKGLHPPDGGYVSLDTQNWLPSWLQQAGYRTMHLGKFLNGYGTQNPDPTEVPPGFDDWQGSVDPTTYGYRDFTLNENGRLVRYANDVYQTDFFADRGAELIERASRDSRPFFFSLAFVAPHHGGPIEPDDPGQGLKTPAVAPRHRDAFAGTPLPIKPNFDEIDVSDKPWHIRRRKPLDPEKVAAMTELYQQRLESLLSLDEAVDRIVEALRRRGELDNTLIIYTSDNGYLIGDHRVPAAKVLGYEGSIRVPLLMRGPGVPAGARRRQLVTNVDLSPTILDAANAMAGKPQDGRSLFPLLKDAGLSWARDLLVVGYGQGARFSAVRTARYLYARYTNGNRELYDLKQDPYQLESRHRGRGHAQIRSDLYRRLRRLQRCRGKRCAAGPRIRLETRPRAGCTRRSIDVRLVGEDRFRLKKAAFFVGRRRMSRLGGPNVVRAGRVPVRGVRPGRRYRLRVRALLEDGSILTLDSKRRSCRIHR